MLYFNDSRKEEHRTEFTWLSLEEEQSAINILNVRLGKSGITPGEEQQIQHLIYHYENLSHYHARTYGLYATTDDSFKDDPRFFKLCDDHVPNDHSAYSFSKKDKNL